MAQNDRIVQHLECQKCKRRNYTYRRNKMHKQDKLEIKKFCRFCRSHTVHKTVKG
ncbi:MAG: 50S ribosomal protein L33 [Elusimicrobia bacterium]|nr:50S ribosomal protein L33 [Elusimicrobiota bacterium]